jgi:hypothetical protein
MEPGQVQICAIVYIAVITLGLDAISLGGVGHCFAWHVRVPSSCDPFIFIISMNIT